MDGCGGCGYHMVRTEEWDIGFCSCLHPGALFFFLLPRLMLDNCIEGLRIPHRLVETKNRRAGNTILCQNL